VVAHELGEVEDDARGNRPIPSRATSTHAEGVPGIAAISSIAHTKNANPAFSSNYAPEKSKTLHSQDTTKNG